MSFGFFNHDNHDDEDEEEEKGRASLLNGGKSCRNVIGTSVTGAVRYKFTPRTTT